MIRQLATATMQVGTEEICAYANLTDDYNPIHVDPAFAAATPMGSVIAHGTMSICLLWQSLFRSFGAAALAGAELDVRFVRPVRLGELLEAGGQANADERLYDVWVRAGDGTDRLSGTLRVATPSASIGSNDRESTTHNSRTSTGGTS